MIILHFKMKYRNILLLFTKKMYYKKSRITVHLVGFKYYFWELFYLFLTRFKKSFRNINELVGKGVREDFNLPIYLVILRWCNETLKPKCEVPLIRI